MNYLVLQTVKLNTGYKRLEHEALSSCQRHLGIEPIIGMTADDCYHCNQEWNQAWKHLISANEWLGKIIGGEKVYISGPMSGLPDDNRPAFRMMEHALKLRGANVLSPANNDPTWSYEQNMRYDLYLLTEARVIVMLRGWRKSKGAKVEFNAAQSMKLKTYYEK